MNGATMNENPLVSISIPTYNSEAFIERCLRATYSQTYKNIEVIIIDGCSTDNTKMIARKSPVTFIEDGFGLLNARKVGVERSSGEFILLLDSDQILEPDAVERAVEMIQRLSLDMLVLGEDVFRDETLLEKLFHLDRKLVHAVRDFSPYTGVMLPRFYRRAMLRRALRNIPEPVLRTGGQDHALIYFEAWQISQKVDLLPDAVKHIEPGTLAEIIPKFFRWGATSIDARHPRYRDLLQRKEGFRKGTFQKGLWGASLGSIALLLIKGLPYQLGRLVSSVRSMAGRE